MNVFSEKFILNHPESKPLDLDCAPKFLVPLRIHVAPQGYECYMSCAIKGNPRPHVTWFHNDVSLNEDSNYFLSNTCGVCSMLILRVGPNNVGEYKVVADNPLGEAECATQLTVRGNYYYHHTPTPGGGQDGGDAMLGADDPLGDAECPTRQLTLGGDHVEMATSETDGRIVHRHVYTSSKCIHVYGIVPEWLGY